ncbi:hypothetical protein PR048_013871 [Dryococelus australis]|uniref:Uncharacterized protein n=1 Tax=Dryococelus australis TaxID=614101 RepID=A0ABQ9HTE1_9NEOP|nr:hypothetical protein PR048_013871 [Dryococelus australis]
MQFAKETGEDINGAYVEVNLAAGKSVCACNRLWKKGSFMRVELANMRFMYGAAHTNARQTVELYRLRHPAQPQPSSATFARLHQR